MALLLLPKGRLCAVGVKANVPFVRLAKIVFKKVRWEKNKKHWVGLSVGCLVLSCQYFFFLSFHNGLLFLIFCLSFLSPTLAGNGRRICEVAGGQPYPS